MLCSPQARLILLSGNVGVEAQLVSQPVRSRCSALGQAEALRDRLLQMPVAGKEDPAGFRITSRLATIRLTVRAISVRPGRNSAVPCCPDAARLYHGGLDPVEARAVRADPGRDAM